MDVHKIHFVQVQDHLAAIALDLSAHILELLTSKLAAQPNSGAVFLRESFNFQRHIGGFGHTESNDNAIPASLINIDLARAENLIGQGSLPVEGNAWKAGGIVRKRERRKWRPRRV